MLYIFQLVEQINVELKNWLNNEITNKNKYKTTKTTKQLNSNKKCFKKLMMIKMLMMKMMTTTFLTNTE